MLLVWLLWGWASGEGAVAVKNERYRWLRTNPEHFSNTEITQDRRTNDSVGKTRSQSPHMTTCSADRKKSPVSVLGAPT